MNLSISSTKQRNPWFWIPTVYVAEGLPYFAVNTLTVLIYTQLGIGLTEMAFYTGWLYLPWVIKPFWSPFIDLIKTKRWWTITMEFLIGICMASVAFFLPGGFFFSSTLAVFWLMAFFSATHDIAADGYYMLELSSHQQAAFVGVRSTFYRVASILGQGVLVMLAGWLEHQTSKISLSWAIVFGILSIFFISVSLYHCRFMPESADDRPVAGVTASNILRDFAMTFVTFFKKPHVVSALIFMLLYRLPEALCIKLVQPFFISSRESGGLGLTTSEVGFINGTVGVVALLLGGIIGGVVISRGGLKKWLWPMALSLSLPCVLYCWLAMAQPESMTAVCSAVFVEQFGYGFGFSAYMLYLIYFSRGESQTSHYAFCTAFMALGMMIPGMTTGWLHEMFADFSLTGTAGPQGYINFFWLVMIACVATLVATALIKVSPEFGKKK